MTLEEFHIDLNRHKEDEFQLHFELNDTFFALKEHSIFSEGNLQADVEVHRVDHTIHLNYQIHGHVEECCERCLQPITLKIAVRGLEAYKLTSDPELLDQENHLDDKHPVIELYDRLYEEICLSAPNRLICEYAEEDRICEYPQNEETGNGNDPRWDQLKELIKK